MWLQRLNLFQFKNYPEGEFHFVKGINCLTGKNGSGKTNVLDAIHYLCFTKSFFNVTDAWNIQQEADLMMVQGRFNRLGLEEEITIAVKRNHRKTVKNNGNEYDKLSDHIGLYPLVMIVPGDINYIYEGSEDRRRGMDMVISQVDKVYLQHLSAYNKALEQRNRQLKIFAEEQVFDRELLFLWETPLVASGTYIYRRRQQYVEELNSLFSDFYASITQHKESVQLVYQSGLSEMPLAELFELNLQRDLALQRTTSGVHKDDLELLINGQPLRKFGSQGQQKSFIISLKLAEYQYLKAFVKHTPILLLDDIFEKIDEQRAQLLLKLIRGGMFGQIFITDTHLDRLKAAFKDTPEEVRFFEIDNGNIVPLSSEI